MGSNFLLLFKIDFPLSNKYVENYFFYCLAQGGAWLGCAIQ